MSDLLGLALDAHGELENWNAFSSAQIRVGGAIWTLRQQEGLLADIGVTIDTHQEHLTISRFGGAARRSVFVPDHLQIETEDGGIIEERHNPESAFAGHVRETPWDQLHVAYFASEALWTYLTLPFLYTYPGFVTEEIEPWQEDGEIWRRLRVTFPDYIKSHTRTQITHFGPDGLMRRHDYTVDVLGGAPGANYTTDYRDFQGIKIPTRRRVYAYDAAMRKVPEPLLVSINFDDIALS